MIQVFRDFVCQLRGCQPQWLPDYTGVEYGPSERMCRRCKRYVNPHSDQAILSCSPVPHSQR
jgi:hypothetical protein